MTGKETIRQVRLDIRTELAAQQSPGVESLAQLVETQGPGSQGAGVA